MEMFLDLQDIESMDGNGLRRRMEWAMTEDELDAQTPHPDEDPRWWLDRRGEIARGQVLLSGMNWPRSGMPNHGTGDTGARWRSYEQGRGPGSPAGGGRFASLFFPGLSISRGSSFPRRPGY
jgi:hypothetical protein